MEPPLLGDYYDPGLPGQDESVVEEEIRSESVLGAAPEAKEGGNEEEEDLGLMDGINRKGDVSRKGDQEGSIGHEVDIDHEAHGTHESHKNHAGAAGDQEPRRQLAEMAHVAAAAAPQQDNAQPSVQSSTFTPAQLRELESIYEHTQDPDWFARRIIVRRIGMTEARVQVSNPDKSRVARKSS
uniref:Rhox homeobox family member 1 n=1 Tax=Molossus molossus TaxID=27622 RepID=A0A7J8J7Q1_MOLMO|nr:Rhox homeobox family member 1 [Molossus molossus]